MPPKIRRIPASVASLALLLLTAWPLAAQFQDGRVPDSGQLWFHLNPTLENWSDQFAQNSSLFADGEKEPLFAHVDGPIVGRLFPGAGPLLDDINTDAAVLGFDAVVESDLSLGALDFSTISAQKRTLGLGFELGVIDGLSIGFNAPFTLTDVESAFAFDSLSATVTSATSAFPASGTFFTESQTALTGLQALIDGGSLTGPALTDAMTLRDDADAFLTALQGRSSAGGLIPTAASPAGAQMAQRFADLMTAFDALGLALPGLTLPTSATSGDLDRLFLNSLAAFAPTSARNGMRLGEVELSARFNLIDGITRRRSPGPDLSAVDSTGAAPAALDSADLATPSAALQLRTTVGVTLRLPVLSASFPPFANAPNFVDVPIGDGQTDIELALYQDVSYRKLLFRSMALYGIQRPDALILRVAPPDRPFAFESLQTIVFRDLGDYLMITLRPSLRLNSALSVGLEWEYFRLGAPSFALSEPLADVADAGVLALEGAQQRQRIGIGLTYDLSEAQGRESLSSGTPQVRSPLQFGISLRTPLSGSGGLTPASFRFASGFRIPLGKIF